jgi:hypothetical protein
MPAPQMGIPDCRCIEKRPSTVDHRCERRVVVQWSATEEERGVDGFCVGGPGRMGLPICYSGCQKIILLNDHLYI